MFSFWNAAQDEMGRARFGYSHPGHSADHYRDAAGNQVGRWAYISPEGKQLRFNYVADSNGFQVAPQFLDSIFPSIDRWYRQPNSNLNTPIAVKLFQPNQVLSH